MASLEETFRNLYDTALQNPVAEILEIRRKRRILALRVLAATGIASLICIPPALFFSTLSPLWLILLWGIPVLFLLVFFWIFFGGGGEERQLFKILILPKIVSAIDSGLNYDYERSVSWAAFERSGLFTHPVDRFSGEDCVSGTYHGVGLTMSELHAECKTETRDKNGNQIIMWQDIFRGVFLIADFHKDFKTRTFVLPDTAENLFGQLIGNFFQKWNMVQEGNLVRMENTEFEKYFAVYAQDDVEARYLLSPRLMEQMVELRQRYNTQISFSFTDSLLYVAIPSARDFFEIPTGELDYEALKRSLYEFLYFLQIIDELNLDVRIWSKE